MTRAQLLARAGIAAGAAALGAAPEGARGRPGDLGGRARVVRARNRLPQPRRFPARAPSSACARRDRAPSPRARPQPVGVPGTRNQERLERNVHAAASAYLGVDRLTSSRSPTSTTMGLGLLYGGLRPRAGQEVLMTRTTSSRPTSRCASRPLRRPVRGPLYDDPARAAPTTRSSDACARAQPANPRRRAHLGALRRRA